MDAYDRLRQFEILDHLSDSQVEQLSSCISRIQHPSGDFVLSEGDRSRDIYLIDIGEVHIQRNTPYGMYTLARLRPGDIFGEASFIDENVRSGDAFINIETVLFTTNLTVLTPLLNNNQNLTLAIYWALWKSLSAKLRYTNDLLAQFFSKNTVGPSAPSLTTNKETTTHVELNTKKKLFTEQKLSQMEINFLATLSKEQKFQANEYIFHEGQSGDSMYIVLEGQVMISKQITGAGEEALAFLERGDYFGEMALIDLKPRSADAKARETGALVLSISRSVLEGILNIQKVSSLNLLQILCTLVAKRLREINNKLVGWFIFAASSGDSLELPDL